MEQAPEQSAVSEEHLSQQYLRNCLPACKSLILDFMAEEASVSGSDSEDESGWLKGESKFHRITKTLCLVESDGDESNSADGEIFSDDEDGAKKLYAKKLCDDEEKQLRKTKKKLGEWHELF